MAPHDQVAQHSTARHSAETNSPTDLRACERACGTVGKDRDDQKAKQRIQDHDGARSLYGPSQFLL